MLHLPALSLSKVVGTVKIVESCSAGCLVEEDSVLCSEPLAMIALRDSVKVNGELRLVDGFVVTGHLLTACLRLWKENGGRKIRFSVCAE